VLATAPDCVRPAHRLLDRLVQLSPDLAEAHKLRALVRARLGDYTGAMQEVSWWRPARGALASPTPGFLENQYIPAAGH
jgi:hypothetical protein